MVSDRQDSKIDQISTEANPDEKKPNTAKTKAEQGTKSSAKSGATSRIATSTTYGTSK